MKITDTLLSAYVDGELSAAERAEVEVAAKGDPRVAARLEARRRSRTRIAGAFGAIRGAAPGRRLVATLGDTPTVPDNVVDLGRARERRAPQPAKPQRGWLAWSAVAACLALALVAQSRLAPPTGPLIGYGSQGLTAKGALAGALDKQLVEGPSATSQPVRILLSFRSTDGRYCRSFQVARGPALAGVACREVDGWRVRTATVSTPTAVSDTVRGMMAGSPLDAAGEAAALSRGWRP